jgi:hypothetical protein
MGKSSAPQKKPFGAPKGKKDLPPAPVSDDEDDDEEEEDFSDEEGSDSEMGSLGSMNEEEEEVDIAEITTQLKFAKKLYDDTLEAFMRDGEGQGINAATVERIYAARGVVAQQVDPILSATSEFAAEYRAMALEHLATLNEHLFEPRGRAAEAELKTLSVEELDKDGTGLMWSAALNAVATSLADHFSSPPFEFTPQDESIFNFCLNVIPSFVESDPFKGVVFDFHFAMNPYFSNPTLRCSFHYPTASLSLTRIGVEAPCVTAVRCTDTVQWKGKYGFEVPPKDAIPPTSYTVRDTIANELFDVPAASEQVKQEVKELMCLWPRPVFSALFAMNTSAATQDLLTAKLLVNPRGDRDEAPGGRAHRYAQAMEMGAWLAFVQDLNAAVRAPMITIMDSEDQDAIGDEENEEDEEGDEGSGEEKETAKPKKNRAEGKAPAPEECKQA